MYLVILLPILFPIHGGLVLSETTNPILYTLQYLIVGGFVAIGMFAIIVYMIEQVYIFRVGTIFIWIRELAWYQEVVRTSGMYQLVMSGQNIIIPLGVLLMVYKLFLANILSAIVLSIVYNLSNIGFYRKKETSSYRVEFHEVGMSNSGQEQEEHTQ